jgi:hypothetical protein
MIEIIAYAKRRRPIPGKDHESKICPRCGAWIRAMSMQEGGGVECAEKCGYWFCY